MKTTYLTLALAGLLGLASTANAGRYVSEIRHKNSSATVTKVGPDCCRNHDQCCATGDKCCSKKSGLRWGARAKGTAPAKMVCKLGPAAACCAKR